MANYIVNSKNRKFKNRVLSFASKINFGALHLPLAGKIIVFFCLALVTTLFFKWFDIRTMNGHEYFYPFESYLGKIGYFILLSVGIILFFLLSHTKKEKLKAHLDLRISDIQVISTVSIMLLFALIQIAIIAQGYREIKSAEITILSPHLFAMIFCIGILIGSRFLAKQDRENSINMSYLSHSDDILGKNISASGGEQSDSDKKKNMSLPF